GLYEVVRSYYGRLFQMEAHIERLNYGAQQICLHTTDFSYLTEVCQTLLEKNGLLDKDATVYIQITRGVAARLHTFPGPDTPETVFASVQPFKAKTEQMENGVKILLVPDQRWARTDIKSVNLLPNVIAQQRAVDAGAAEAVFVRDGAVTEGSHSSFFAVLDGTVITRPRSNYILAGITRQVILDLCHQLNLPFEEKSIFQEKVYDVDEAFISGTTTEITPVVQIDERTIASGKPGPITKKLQEAFGMLVE
ncbi:aminotransferase class IV, partial [bacterium]|nr:aminotransferase class IV [bacterium]